MDSEFMLPVNGKMQISGKNLTIEIVLREIGGNSQDRKGLIEVFGSPLVNNGSRKEVTKHEYIKLASDLELTVAHRKAPKEYIRLSGHIPDYYKVICSNE